MRWMKRIAKWIAWTAFGVVGVIAIAVSTLWGYYRSVVDAKPGALQTKIQPSELGASVDPFIATGGFPWMCGHDTPAATTPFGMVRLGPDTSSILRGERGNNRSGYFYGDDKIIGFSHTRLVGADALEGGIFRIFPTVEPRVEKMLRDGAAAHFSHDEERAFPGYYAVSLPRDGVLVELTATPRVGVHRYTFRADGMPHLLLDVTSALGKRRCENGLVRILPDAREVEGSVREYGSFSSRYGGLDVHFVARFSQPFSAFGAVENGAATVGKVDATGNRLGADLAFGSLGAGGAVEVRLAISYVSLANARANLEAEAGNQSFDEVAAAARDLWERRLATARVQGGTNRQRRIFYTALYHTMLMPTVFNDTNGEYMGFDRAITHIATRQTRRTVQHELQVLVRRVRADCLSRPFQDARENDQKHKVGKACAQGREPRHVGGDGLPTPLRCS